MSSDNGVVEAVAEAIYRHEGGMSDEDLLQGCGKTRRAWKTDAPWDSQPNVELCEHERDDYRTQARAAIQAFTSFTSNHKPS